MKKGGAGARLIVGRFFVRQPQNIIGGRLVKLGQGDQARQGELSLPIFVLGVGVLLDVKIIGNLFLR